MIDGPLTVVLAPTPGRAAQPSAHAGDSRLARVCASLNDLADRGPHLLRASAIAPAEVVVHAVRQLERELAHAGTPVDQRAALVVSTMMPRELVAARDWPRVRGISADSDLLVNACARGDAGTAGCPHPFQVAAGPALMQWIRRLRNLRNSEGVTLADAAAERTATGIREESYAPAD
jgi:hypothetical protein